jgi:hypothetical protein
MGPSISRDRHEPATDQEPDLLSRGLDPRLAQGGVRLARLKAVEGRNAGSALQSPQATSLE